MTEGSGFFVTETEKIPLVPGNAVFATRNAKHGFIAGDDNPLSVVWIFSPPELETVLAGLGTPRLPGEEAPAPFMPPKHVQDILHDGGFAPM